MMLLFLLSDEIIWYSVNYYAIVDACFVKAKVKHHFSIDFNFCRK
jgi:hypothetical protein